MDLNEHLVVKLTKQQIEWAVVWWIKQQYPDDSRGTVNVAGNIDFELIIKDVGQGRIEPRLEGATAAIWFTKPEKKANAK